MVKNIRAFLIEIQDTERVYASLQMALNMPESGIVTFPMDLECMFSQMERGMLVPGRPVKCMDQVDTILKTEIFMMENFGWT